MGPAVREPSSEYGPLPSSKLSPVAKPFVPIGHLHCVISQLVAIILHLLHVPTPPSTASASATHSASPPSVPSIGKAQVSSFVSKFDEISTSSLGNAGRGGSPCRVDAPLTLVACPVHLHPAPNTAAPPYQPPSVASPNAASNPSPSTRTPSSSSSPSSPSPSSSSSSTSGESRSYQPAAFSKRPAANSPEQPRPATFVSSVSPVSSLGKPPSAPQPATSSLQQAACSSQPRSVSISAPTVPSVLPVSSISKQPPASQLAANSFQQATSSSQPSAPRTFASIVRDSPVTPIRRLASARSRQPTASNKQPPAAATAQPLHAATPSPPKVLPSSTCPLPQRLAVILARYLTALSSADHEPSKATPSIRPTVQPPNRPSPPDHRPSPIVQPSKFAPIAHPSSIVHHPSSVMSKFVPAPLPPSKAQPTSKARPPKVVNFIPPLPQEPTP